MVPPRSPPCRRFCSSLPLSHSVIRPTTGSGVGPNSVEFASAMPHRLRAASTTAICMPKQMPKYGTLALARELGGADLSLGAALAEAARHQDAVDVLEERRRILALEHLALDPVELDLDLVGDAAVRQRLDQRLVGVLEAGVLADDRDRDVALRIADALVDGLPALQLRRVAPARCRRRPAPRCRARPRDRPRAPRRCCRRRAPRSRRFRARCRTGRACAAPRAGSAGRCGRAGCRAGCRSSAAP